MKHIFTKNILLLVLLSLLGMNLSAILQVNENIQTWTASSSYGTYTQVIPAGTMNLNRCLVSPGAAANGQGSAGRIQCEASTGIIEFPLMPSVGEVEFTFAAGSSGRSVRLQQQVNETWTNLATFSNINATGSRFFFRVGIQSPVKIRLANPSHAIYVHDIFVTDFQGEALATLAVPTISEVNYDSARLQAYVNSAGTTNITQRGFCWSTSPNPDTLNAHVYLGSGISPIVGEITGLTPNTTYYVRAFAVNGSGLSFSESLSLETQAIGMPTVQASNLVFYPGNTSIQVSWTPGNGSRRLVKINTVNSFTDPQNGIEYSPNPVFQGSGEQVVYCGASQMIEGEEVNAVTVTGLVRNTNYVFRVYELNGNTSETQYLTNSAMGNPSAALTLNVSIDGYYSTATGYGHTLKTNLHNILRESHLTQFSYSALWQQLQYTDEDSLNTNNIIQTYTGWSIPKSYYGTGSTQWNREHTWSVSHGGFETNRPAGTDLHHIRPCDVTVNSAKGNKDFDNGGNPYVDSSPYPGYSGTIGCYTNTNSWEPRPVEKGDVARMLFYMAIRYEGTDTSYNLELLDSVPTTGAYYGKLSTLLQWHWDDPPDSWELRRNDRIQERQGNRNPFVDHPEFITRLWVPRAEQATSISTASFSARWNHSLNAQHYEIDVSADAAFNSFIVQNFPVGYTDNYTVTVQNVDHVYYRVRAFLGGGYSQYSNIIHVNTGNPLEIVSFNTSLIENRQVLVAWNTEYESNTLGYRIYRSISEDFDNAILLSGIIQAYNLSTLNEYSFIDGEVPSVGGDYYYWLEALDLDAVSQFFGPSQIFLQAGSDVTDEYAWNNINVSVYPNPFRQFLNVEYTAKESTQIKVRIFNIKGQLFKDWVTNANIGKNNISWNGTDNKGLTVGSGIYLMSIEMGGKRTTRKVLKLD